MRYRTAGFTAVELLITLFVAAIFLVAGYQLFNLIMKDGGDTRAESAASNVAYDYLRRYGDSATNPCSASTPLTNQAVTVEGATNAKISIIITCPESDATTLSKVEADISYGIGTDANTVKYATYVDKSKGATPNTDITNGLIDWWTLDGNTNDNAGGTSLTNDGATLTTGQSGSPNSAYAFNAGDQKVLHADGYSSKLVGLSAFSITGWVYPQNNPSAHAGFFGIRDNTRGAIYALQLSGTNTLECRMLINSSTYYQPTSPSLTPNTWQLISIVYDGSSLKCYVNTAASNSVSANWSGVTATDIPFSVGGFLTYLSTSSIDDVRVYNRALSASEISQLVANGAK